jgi:hypothetical protein
LQREIAVLAEGGCDDAEAEGPNRKNIAITLMRDVQVVHRAPWLSADLLRLLFWHKTGISGATVAIDPYLPS